jgi:hypothetical protein
MGNQVRLEKLNLMREYAALSGYSYPPFSWDPDDYSIEKWKAMIARAKKR